MISKPKSLTAIALAATALFAGLAQAQDGSVQVYGLIDLSVDRIDKSEGNVTGTVQGLAGPNSLVSPEEKQTRVAPSMTRQSHIGVRGTEPLGSGWEAKFTLEGSVIADNGTMGNDGRMWGRQAWVGLTTPVGELRLGRQVSPMLAAYFVSTLDGIGGTDLFATGAALNNLQTYQDNVISYGVRQGAWAGRLAYSPNAGAAARISPVRSTATNTPTGTIPPAGSAPQLGQILGGLTAGAENDDGRGKTWGAMVAYLGDDLKAVAAYNRNDLSNAQLGLPFRATPLSPDGFLPLFNTEKFTSYMLAAKYKFAFGTELGGSFYQGQLEETGDTDPKMRVLAVSAKHTMGSLDLLAQVMQAKFTNFTKGKDTGVMLGADYNLSKRTAIFARAGRAKDDRGNVANGIPAFGGAGLAGGPVALLVPLGSTEVPLFSGAGMNIDADTKMLGIGIRHSF